MSWSQPVIKILLTGILVVALIFLSVLFIEVFRRIFGVKNDREHVVKLTNKGNFQSIFYLSVTSPENSLKFKLLLNGIPLVEVPPEIPQEEMSVETVSEAPSPEPQPVAAPIDMKTGQKNNPKTTQKTEQKDDKKQAPKMDGAVKGGKAVASKAGFLASFLGTLGSFLPGSMGSGLRAQSQSLRDVQTRTNTATQAPASMQRKAGALTKQTGKVVVAKPGPSTVSTPARAAGQPQIHGNMEPDIVPTQAMPAAKTAQKTVPAESTLVRTQPVDPGAGLSLVLRITAKKKRLPESTFSYSLKSLQEPVEQLDGEEAPVVRQGIVHFPHTSLWRYWLAPVFSVLVVASLLLASIFIFNTIWY